MTDSALVAAIVVAGLLLLPVVILAGLVIGLALGYSVAVYP